MRFKVRRLQYGYSDRQQKWCVIHLRNDGEIYNYIYENKFLDKDKNVFFNYFYRSPKDFEFNSRREAISKLKSLFKVEEIGKREVDIWGVETIYEQIE